MGEVVGQFELHEVLGGGGMATVYRAEHRSGIGMRAAVKKLHPHLAADEQLRKRLRVEAEALARLEHPNVVRLLDYVDGDAGCALVTELVEGHTLRKEIEHDGEVPMPFERAIDLFRQMLLGVGHAHAHQCLHRDIKPGNVMVTGESTIKVLDFGIASLLDTESMTRTGISIGTPAYMAPEQVEGMEGLDERADIYALGVTFWEMLAGPGARPRRKGWRLGPEGFERLRRGGISDPMVRFVERMVEWNADDRLATIPEVQRALESALAGEDEDGEPSTLLWSDPSEGEATVPLSATSPVLKVADVLPPPEPTLKTGPQTGTKTGTKTGTRRRKKDPTRKKVRDPGAVTATALVEPGPRWLPWLGGATALVALGLLGATMLRGPSLAEVRGGPAVASALRAVPGAVFFDRGAFYSGPDDRKTVLSAFALDATEVTLGQWAACAQAEGWACPDLAARYRGNAGALGSDDEPVQFVAWAEAAAFCGWRGKELSLPEGYVARLPTDAEWERAARGAGRPGRLYPHGEAFDPAMATVSGSRLPPAGSTHSDRTPDGVHDLTGSVEEWLSDRGPEGGRSDTIDTSYPSEAEADPIGAGSLAVRAVRGGNQEGGGVREEFYRSQGRRWVQASRRASGRGLRCAYGVDHEE